MRAICSSAFPSVTASKSLPIPVPLGIGPFIAGIDGGSLAAIPCSEFLQVSHWPLRPSGLGLPVMRGLAGGFLLAIPN